MYVRVCEHKLLEALRNERTTYQRKTMLFITQDVSGHPKEDHDLRAGIDTVGIRAVAHTAAVCKTS